MTDNLKCVLSIGIRCFTEIYLKYTKLKKFSGIFDGLYLTNVNSIIYILQNKFIESDLIYTENNDNIIINDLNNRHGFRTIHKNLNYDENNLISSFHNAFMPHHNYNCDKVKIHFDKCFSRFEVIKKHKIKTLFCLFCHPGYSSDKELEQDDILLLNDYLQKEYNYHLLFIKFECFDSKNSWEILQNTNDNITFINVNNSNVNSNSQAKVLDEIFKYMNVIDNELLTYNDLEILCNENSKNT